MTLLLTSAQETAIASGAKVRQVWKIVVPSVSGGTPNFNWTIHDDAANTSRVLRRGSRSNSAYNISLKQPGELESMAYDIVVDNSSGGFYPFGSGNFFTGVILSPPSTYQAMPRECLLRHEVHVWSAGAWSELPCSPWIGRIVDVDYTPAIGNDGVEIPGSATIRAEGYLNAELNKTWTLDHGTHSEVTTSYSPMGLYIGSISSGWDTSGGYKRYWLQFTSNITSSAVTTLYYLGQISYTKPTVSTGPTTTHQISHTETSYFANHNIQFRSSVTTSGGLNARYKYPQFPIIRTNIDASTARPW